MGATRFDESGWRTASPSEVRQAVADVAYRDETVDGGVTFTYANSSLNGNAPAPVELLDVDRSAVFTYPDITDNRLGFVQGRFDIAASPTWSVQVTGYYRDLDRNTLNGDEAEFEECDDDLLPPGAPHGTLCFGADDDDDDDDDHGGHTTDHDDDHDDDHGGHDDHDEEAQPLVDVTITGHFITEDDTEGDAAYNRTTTRSKGSTGATLQATAATTPTAPAARMSSCSVSRPTWPMSASPRTARWARSPRSAPSTAPGCWPASTARRRTISSIPASTRPTAPSGCTSATRSPSRSRRT